MKKHLQMMVMRIPEMGSFILCLQHAGSAVSGATRPECYRSYTGNIYQLAVPVSMN